MRKSKKRQLKHYYIQLQNVKDKIKAGKKTEANFSQKRELEKTIMNIETVVRTTPRSIRQHLNLLRATRSKTKNPKNLENAIEYWQKRYNEFFPTK